jgi:hypothetical protein
MALGSNSVDDQRSCRRLAGPWAYETSECEHHQVEPPIAGARYVPVQYGNSIVIFEQGVAVVEVAVDDPVVKNVGSLATIERGDERRCTGGVNGRLG